MVSALLQMGETVYRHDGNAENVVNTALVGDAVAISALVLLVLTMLVVLVVVTMSCSFNRSSG